MTFSESYRDISSPLGIVTASCLSHGGHHFSSFLGTIFLRNVFMSKIFMKTKFRKASHLSEA